MKTKILAATVVFGAVIAVICGILFLNSPVGFDLLQRIKYPEYYSWRSGHKVFPKDRFWIGFNTDRHRKNIFIGRSLRDIQSFLPIVTSVPTDDGQLSFFIA